MPPNQLRQGVNPFSFSGVAFENKFSDEGDSSSGESNSSSLRSSALDKRLDNVESKKRKTLMRNYNKESTMINEKKQRKYLKKSNLFENSYSDSESEIDVRNTSMKIMMAKHMARSVENGKKFNQFNEKVLDETSKLTAAVANLIEILKNKNN